GGGMVGGWRLGGGLVRLWVVRVWRERDLLDGLRFAGRALDRELARLPHQIVLGGFEEIGRDLPCLVANFSRSDRRRGTGDRRRAARVGAEAVWRGVGVALLDLDILRGDPELLGEDLRVRGLVALALRLRAEAGNGLARGMHADLAAVEHLQAEDVEMLGRAGAHDLGEARDADAHELTALAL